MKPRYKVIISAVIIVPFGWLLLPYLYKKLKKQ